MKALDLLREERQLRTRAYASSSFFAGDLSKLESHHALVAAELAGQLDRGPWPGIFRAGFEDAQAWAEMAHLCWSEPVLMRRCLRALEDAFRRGDAWGDWFAKLYDTVMFFENKPQVYGSYLEWDKTKRLSPWTIVKEKEVARRRAVIELESLEDYVARSRRTAKEAGMSPPSDLAQHRADLDAWARRRGWKRKAGLA